MGWTGRRETEGQAIARVLREMTWSASEDEASASRVVDGAVTRESGNVCLWLAIERTWFGEGLVELRTERGLGLWLLDVSRAGWVHEKALGEEDEPYYYSCPLSVLDQVPEPASERAKAWRAKVREAQWRMGLRKFWPVLPPREVSR